MKQHRFACRACSRWFEFESPDSETVPAELDCPFCASGPARALPPGAPSPKTGSYKYNKRLRRLIKVSDSVPGLSGGGHNCASCAGGNCSSCGH
ncbi:MAG: hypothetical protein GX410_09890 [Elusimicrobia bacterium]|nr:hypothetical protein [Elusimicrobiota bacterium]